MQLEQLTELAVKIAPELSLAPWYLINQPAEIETPIECSAYYLGPRVPARFRDYLQSIGAWRGWGPAIVLVDEPELGFFVHELGHLDHLLRLLKCEDTEPSYSEKEFQDFAFKRLSSAADSGNQLPWFGHDDRFIRRVLHLHARAVDAGHCIPLSELCASGPQYATAPTLDYWQAIGDEPWRLRAATFSEIEALPAPSKFSELWIDDVTKHISRSSTRWVA